MLYNLKDPKVLSMIVDIIESNENKDRIERHTKAYKIINGDQRKIIEDELAKKYPESYDEMTVISLEIGGKIIRKLSRAYANGAIREIVDIKSGEKATKINDLFQVIYKNISEEEEGINIVMDKANKLYSNHLYVEMFSYIDEENKIRLKPMPQNLFTALPNETKTKAEVIVFKQEKASLMHYQSFIDYDNVDPIFQENGEVIGIYTVWSAKENFTFVKVKAEKIERSLGKDEQTVIFAYLPVKKDNNPNGINPYGIMTFASIKKATEGQFYPYGNETAEISKDLNIIFSDIVSIAALQGYGQAVIYYDGDTPPQISKSGPTHVVAIPNKDGKSKFEFANPNPDLKGHLDIALAITRILLTTNDLTTDKVSGELAATNFASAIDRLIADSETIENIEDQQKKYRVTEKKLFKIFLAQLKYLKENDSWPEDYPQIDINELDPSKYSLKLEFNTIKPLTTEKEKATTIIYLEDNGFIFPWEKHIKFNESLTEQEAKRREEELSKIREEKMLAQVERVNNASKTGQEDQFAKASSDEQEDGKNSKDTKQSGQRTTGELDNRSDKEKD